MNKLFSKWPTSRLLLALAFVALAFAAQPARAGDSVPDWFRQLAHAPLPKYPDEADAVVVLNEETLTVRDNGEMYLNTRRVVKILRNGGKDEAIFGAYSDKDTKIDSLRGWSISPTGQEYELKEKDAIETSPWDDGLFADTRYKLLKLPGAEIGAYVGYESQQRYRPYAYSHKWMFQENIPVKTSRFTINLPAGWEYNYRFGNWDEKKPQNASGNVWTWEIDDIPGIEHEPNMPARPSLEGAMAVSFYSPSLGEAAKVSTWNGVAHWADSLESSRRIPTPKMQAKVTELTQAQKDVVDKMRVLSGYVQHNVRYVEIAIGIGGFQAHMAGDTFANSYGDCKDKATLLMTMLKEAGIDSYFVLVHDERGVVNPSLPTPWAFNHAIVAIKIPDGVDTTVLYPIVDDPKLGKILFFDPTNDIVPFGMIPAYEQGSYALVVANGGGQLIKMPVLPPALNRLLRVAHLQLTPEGALIGEVQEIRSGAEASNLRRTLLSEDREHRVKYMERYLAEFLDGAHLTYASIGALDKFDEPLQLHYKFEVAQYAKSAGDLLLVRPRVLGNKGLGVAEDKKRKYPVSYSSTSLQSDMIDIKLPPGYTVDELPSPTEVTAPFAEYKSKIEAKDGVLYYNRSYTVKDLLVPMDQMATLKTFMRGVAADERNTAVLKKAP